MMSAINSSRMLSPEVVYFLKWFSLSDYSDAELEELIRANQLQGESK
jgi:hypothetical protein